MTEKSTQSATSLPGKNELILRPLIFPKVERSRDGQVLVKPGAGLQVKNRIFRSSISGQFDHYNETGSEARIRWEEKFARGGVGAIISSFVPVHIKGRILWSWCCAYDDGVVLVFRFILRLAFLFLLLKEFSLLLICVLELLPVCLHFLLLRVCHRRRSRRRRGSWGWRVNRS